MTKKKGPKIPPDLAIWIEARQRHRLNDAQVQMARELGLNPKKLGKIDNHEQESWKEPLPEYIETLYRKRFHKSIPDQVVSIEQRAAQIHAKKQQRKQARLASASFGMQKSSSSPEAENKQSDGNLAEDQTD